MSQPAHDLRSVLRVGASTLALLSLTAGGAEAQQRSGPVAVQLGATSLPRVRLDAVPEQWSATLTFRINTPYRVELYRPAGAGPVVLLDRQAAGQVPWAAVLARLRAGSESSGEPAPITIDLVLAPGL